MAVLYYANLSFEDELNSRVGYSESPASDRALREIGIQLAWCGGPEDLILIPDTASLSAADLRWQNAPPASVVSSVPADVRIHAVHPWGWTTEALRLAERLGVERSALPDADAVRRVNGRPFSAEFDAVLHLSADGQIRRQCPSPFGTLCSTLKECRSAVEKFRSRGWNRWVAKPIWSHAGRNRLIAEGMSLNDQQQGWLDRNLQLGPVYAEPWVKPLFEFSTHVVVTGIPCHPEPAEVGAVSGLPISMTQLINDHVGRYRGTLIADRISLCDTVQDRIRRHATAIGAAASLHGFRGPLGIDGFFFEDPDGSICLRMCNDINGRLTMGRVGIELRQRLVEAGRIAADAGVLWWHRTLGPGKSVSSVREEATAEFRRLTGCSGKVSVLRTSALQMNGRACRTCSLLVSGLPADPDYVRK